jgi:hypothetical protein
MKKTNLLVAGAFVGVFSLGALLAPIGESSANTVNASIKKMSVTQTQTATGTETPKGETGPYNCPMDGTSMGSGAGMMGQHFAGTMPAVIAEALGMTVEELQTARQDGKSLADIATDKGVQEKDLLAAMIQSKKVEFEKLVKDGTMTKDQMDQMLKNMETMMETAIQQKNFGMINGMGMMNGHGGKMGMGFGGRGNNNQNDKGI